MKINMKIKAFSHPYELNVHHAFHFSNKKLIMPSVHNELVDYPTLAQNLSISRRAMDELQQGQDLLRKEANRLKS